MTKNPNSPYGLDYKRPDSFDNAFVVNAVRRVLAAYALSHLGIGVDNGHNSSSHRVWKHIAVSF